MSTDLPEGRSSAWKRLSRTALEPGYNDARQSLAAQPSLDNAIPSLRRLGETGSAPIAVNVHPVECHALRASRDRHGHNADQRKGAGSRHPCQQPGLARSAAEEWRNHSHLDC
jgi:hypothetical protein